VVLHPSSWFFFIIDSATQLLHTFNSYTHPSFSKKNLFWEVHVAVKFRREKECLWPEIRVSEKLLLICHHHTPLGVCMYAFLCLCVQVGNYIHYMSMFVTGFAVGFSAEQTLAVVPAIAITGSFHGILFCH
jgi:hypothetical protein